MYMHLAILSGSKETLRSKRPGLQSKPTLRSKRPGLQSKPGTASTLFAAATTTAPFTLPQYYLLSI
jgi:hypothetical protein